MVGGRCRTPQPPRAPPQRRLAPGRIAVPCAFAASRRLTSRRRWSPGALAAALAVPSSAGAKSARCRRRGRGARGLSTVGELLEHMPRDDREARTRRPRAPASRPTVTVEVRSIAGRAVRKRGTPGLVEASVFDAERVDARDFFNSRGWWGAIRRAHALSCTARQMAAGASAVPPCGRCGVEGQEPGHTRSVADYPASEGVSSTRSSRSSA